MISKTMVDDQNIKYAEVVEPVSDKSFDQCEGTNYKITRVELGKQSFVGCQMDVRDALEHFTQRSDKLWQKKRMLKEENIHLREELEKSSSLQNVQIFSEDTQQHIDCLEKKTKVMNEWGSQLEVQGVMIIRDAHRIFRKIKTTDHLQEVVRSLEQQLKTLSEDLEVWVRMAEVDLDVLCTYEIVSSKEMYFEFLDQLMNKDQVLTRLIVDVHGAVQVCAEHKGNILKAFDDLTYKLVADDGELIGEEQALAGFSRMIHQEMDDSTFSCSVMDKLAGFRVALNQLHKDLGGCNGAISKAASVARKTMNIAQHTGAPDPNIIHKSLTQFETCINFL